LKNVPKVTINPIRHRITDHEVIEAIESPKKKSGDFFWAANFRYSVTHQPPKRDSITLFFSEICQKVPV